MKSKQYFPISWFTLNLTLLMFVWLLKNQYILNSRYWESDSGPGSQNFHWSLTLIGRFLKVCFNLLQIFKLKIILPFDNWQDLFAFRVMESRTCFKTLWGWSNVSVCHLLFFLGWSPAKIRARLRQSAITRLHSVCLNEYSLIVNILKIGYRASMFNCHILQINYNLSMSMI